MYKIFQLFCCYLKEPDIYIFKCISNKKYWANLIKQFTKKERKTNLKRFV